MTQCQCEGIGSKFDDAYAAEKLALYRAQGADPTTRALLEALHREGIEGATLLDIGGGVGAIQHDLLEWGAASAVEVEASAAYVEACQAEAERQGHADRIEHVLGDFASVADRIEPADIVTLDRSVCCWHDMPALLGAAAPKARRLLGMVYPRDRLWIRIGWKAYNNLRNLIRRNPMRVFIHRTVDVDARLREAGLTRHSSRQMGVWQVVVYAREDAGG